MFARRLGATEYAQQRGAVLVSNRSTQLIQIVSEMVNHPENGVTVGKKNIVPHHRITRGNPGKIAEPAGSIPENIHILVFSRQCIDQ